MLAYDLAKQGGRVSADHVLKISDQLKPVEFGYLCLAIASYSTDVEEVVFRNALGMAIDGGGK
ncbi:MAG TPA: hypothetical protein VG347_05095 [Verrucomicrobiae bacterium]|nr:hypothetical protein [Verrucomicrobiae bacterium]